MRYHLSWETLIISSLASDITNAHRQTCRQLLSKVHDNEIHTCHWARQGAPRRGTGRCASPGWSGRSSGCRRWWRGTPSSEPPLRPAWWRGDTGSKTAPGPRKPSPARPMSPRRTKSTGCAWCTSARKWTCARCHAAWTCWRKLRWEPGACSPYPPTPLWDPSCPWDEFGWM